MSTEDQAERSEEGAPMTPHGAARRRLAKAGLGAAGILWTTRSHATLNFKCVSASAAYSSKFGSNKDDELLACIGRSPGYWKKKGRSWPIPKETVFGDVYGHSGPWDTRISSATMLTLLSPQKFDSQNLAMHMSAAWLNVKSGKIGYLAERTLLQMWHQLNSGHYEPAPGVFWDVERTKRYLEGTYTGD